MSLFSSLLTTEQRLRDIDRLSADQLTEVAAENGYRVSSDSIDDGWMTFRSMSVHGEIALGLISETGPFLLCIALRSISKVIDSAKIHPTPKGFSNAFLVESRGELFDAVKRVYQESQLIGESDYSSFEEFKERTADIGTTESERKTRVRIGQPIFRSALLKFWNFTCPLTGITDSELLIASHIIPWNECETDMDRLCQYNGLLLSSLWDSAFDKFLVTFDTDGVARFSRRLSYSARGVLQRIGKTKIQLEANHQVWMKWHRNKFDELDVT